MPTQLCLLVQYHPYSCNPHLDILISYLLKVTSHYFHTLYPAFSHHYARHTQGLQSISSFPSLTISYWLIQHFHGFVYKLFSLTVLCFLLSLLTLLQLSYFFSIYNSKILFIVNHRLRTIFFYLSRILYIAFQTSVSYYIID